MTTQEFYGHVAIGSVPGIAEATLAVYQHAIAPDGHVRCFPKFTAVLEPDAVQRLRRELDDALRAAHPRMRVRRADDGLLWRIDCPNHPNLPGRWLNQPAALAAAYAHVARHQEAYA